MHKILVLGGSGLVGRAIISEMKQYKEFQLYATYYENTTPLNQDKSYKLDIENPADINNILNATKPQSVISCLRGDYNKQMVLHTKVAEYLRENGGRLYFFSTANVFDNDLSKPHYEDDSPNSSTDYGQYKIACEKRIVEILQDNACILRLPQVWGKASPRMKQLLESMSNNEKVIVYPKLFLNTNTDEMIAKQVSHIIMNKLNGIFHLAAEDVINHKEFYNELINRLGFNSARIEENLEEEGCFALLSKRSNEFPERLRIANKSVIGYLTR